MRKRQAGFFLAAALLLPALGPGGDFAQESAVRLQKPLQHEISVLLKLVQVYVTDRKGNPVRDLNKGDFVIYDNDKPVAVTEFEKHIVASPPGRAEILAASQVSVQAQASTVPPAALNRKFLLFFDYANNNQRGARKAKDAALHFLDTEVKPGDEVGLLSYSLTRGLSFHEPPTQDHAHIRGILAEMDVKGIAGRGDEIEQEYWRLVTEGGEMVGFGQGNTQTIFNWRRQETKSQALNFILKLTALAKGLRYLPGQKNIILFSSGIDASLIYGHQAGAPLGNMAGTRTAFDTGDHILRTQNEEMLKELGAANCAIYAFDVREAAMVPSLFAYDEETFANRSHYTSRDLFTDQGVHQNNDLILKDDRFTGLYSLRRLAKTTGGKYYSNIDAFARNMDDLQTLTSAYYVLGYSVSPAWDGEYHALRVEVRRKGLDVRAQSGYFNPKPFRELSDLEKQLQLLDLALSDAPLFQTPLPAGMGTLVAPPGAGGNLVLLGRLSPQTTDRLPGAKAEILTFVFDDRENLADLHRTVQNLSSFKDRPIIYGTQSSLPPGAYKCRLVVRDLETGDAAVAAARAYIPAPVRGIRLYTPLLLEPAADAAYLESRAAKRPGAPEAGVSWAALYPFDSSRFMPILGPLAQGTARIAAVLPCSVEGLESARIALRAAVVDTATGAKLPLLLIPAAQTVREGTVVQTFEIPTADLAPGSYVFYFYAEDTQTRALAHATAALTVR